MNIQLVQASIIKKAVFSFSRSGGPGGQNVNKVNTKVQISLDISNIDGISEWEKIHILTSLAPRLTGDSTISFFVDEERTQFRNREIAIKRLLSLLIRANHQDKKRIPTKPSKSSKVARLRSKKAHSILKSNRQSPNFDN